ncbi:group I truncated hemoglobin [Thiothrix fructosivorans]|uniref:Group 1 truncated hemoglobin n=1 Tax=Thiothrix fructosivorans TaxID=111770 RepID=A0A8B0SSJ4_9GAMM|nr:group 1 truncated hemoglobin [Thiothrix fructosivorans]MBO0611453.1 group 1 truncated hemoglobin [Thiothrix fructosivorans]QTX12988.1 group 1 truncated hemoglobin [Thiothrix fructosivorans]
MRDVFKRIGGKAAVDAAVDRFYEYMLTDERVKHFFANINMEKQRQHQKDFIGFALGAEDGYAGKDMRSAHQHMVDHMGLADVHFDATLENLVKALRDLNVPENIIAEAGAIVESTRTDVLCR